MKKLAFLQEFAFIGSKKTINITHTMYLGYGIPTNILKLHDFIKLYAF